MDNDKEAESFLKQLHDSIEKGEKPFLVPISSVRREAAKAKDANKDVSIDQKVATNNGIGKNQEMNLKNKNSFIILDIYK